MHFVFIILVAAFLADTGSKAFNGLLYIAAEENGQISLQSSTRVSSDLCPADFCLISVKGGVLEATQTAFIPQFGSILLSRYNDYTCPPYIRWAKRDIWSQILSFFRVKEGRTAGPLLPNLHGYTDANKPVVFMS